MPVPCVPENPVAKQILDSCETVHAVAANRADCHVFVRTALGPFFAPGYFDNQTADQIVGKLQSAAEGWTQSTDPLAAIASAKAGQAVIAGMTGAALDENNGHLAVVVGCDAPHDDPQMPFGYAGSIGSVAAQIAGTKLSLTFPATMVRGKQLDYYCKAPD